MSNITLPTLTMTSKEMADLTEKRHDNVKRTIDTLANQGVISRPQIEEVSNDGPGPKTISQYRIGKRDSYIIVAQLSPEFTARLVDRWQQLEAEAADPMKALSDPATLRQVLLGYTEKVMELEAQVQAAAPKVEAYARLVDAEGLLNPTNAAKALQVEPSKVFKFMRTNRWVYRRPGARSDVAYQDKIEAGWLTHKTYVARREDGTDRLCEQVMVTPKGLTKLAERIAS
jgi:phage regulator Rha-like protein